jgi:hypothetical protein
MVPALHSAKALSVNTSEGTIRVAYRKVAFCRPWVTRAASLRGMFVDTRPDRPPHGEALDRSYPQPVAQGVHRPACLGEGDPLPRRVEEVSAKFPLKVFDAGRGCAVCRRSAARLKCSCSATVKK